MFIRTKPSSAKDARQVSSKVKSKIYIVFPQNRILELELLISNRSYIIDAKPFLFSFRTRGKLRRRKPRRKVNPRLLRPLRPRIQLCRTMIPRPWKWPSRHYLLGLGKKLRLANAVMYYTIKGSSRLYISTIKGDSRQYIYNYHKRRLSPKRVGK